MKKTYRVNLDVTCGKNMVKAMEFKNKLISMGIDGHDITIGRPIVDVDGNYIIDYYTVQIRTNAEQKKKIIKYFKLIKNPDLLYSYMI